MTFLNSFGDLIKIPTLQTKKRVGLHMIMEIQYSWRIHIKCLSMEQAQLSLNQKDYYFNDKKTIVHNGEWKLKSILKSGNQKTTNKILETKNTTFTFLWEIENDKIELVLPGEMNFFQEGRLNLSLEVHIKELSTEIKNLSVISEFQNKHNHYDYWDCLEKLQANPSSIFIQLARIYIREGFLYKELNKLLRCSENKTNQGFKIKYFYVGLMPALNRLSEQTNQELSNNNDKLYRVYRGSAISKQEVKYYQQHQNGNLLRQINCFLSTSIEKGVAERFLENQQNKGIPLKAIYEYELIITKNPPFTFLGINELDQYGEKEVLIHSGAIIKIISIVENPKNQFYIKGKIICSGWKNYFQNFIMSSESNLNLTRNHIGKGAKENIQLLKEALIENNSITTLHLFGNDFGKGATENMQLLKEALIENKSITTLHLFGNDFGKGATENMQLLKEALLENKSIINFDLSFNNFGTGAKENMLLLKEALIENMSITNLELGGNYFGKGAKENMLLLKEALIENKSITNLELGGNYFGKGAKVNMQLLQEALIENRSITYLDLYNNNFGSGAKENMQLLKEALIENKSIINLDLCYNDLTQDDKLIWSNLFGKRIKI